jgi:hypothetical protein
MKSSTRRTLAVLAVLAAILGTPPAQAVTRQRSEPVFVARQSSNNLYAYTIEKNGELRAVSGSPFPAGGSPNSVAVVPSGRFA